MDEQRRRAIAERFAATYLMVPPSIRPTIEESLAALDGGADFDTEVRHAADELLADGSMNDVELERIERMMNATSVQEIIDEM